MMRRLRSLRHPRSLATLLAGGLIIGCAVVLCLIHPLAAIVWLASTALMTWMHA